MAQAPKITKQYLEKAIENGMGQGHGRDYQPWLQIKRWNPSTVSTQSVGGLPPHYRSRAAFMSRNEWAVGLVLSWLGVEVREQYPAWPWSHPHPLYGLDGDSDPELPWSLGMIKICEDMDIRHGVFPGTGIPYVWTLDFVLTIKFGGQYRCAVVSIKPVEDDRYLDPDPLDRALEKLEAERRYCKKLKIPYSITGRSRFDPILISNLEVFRGAAVLENTDRRYRILQDFLDRHGGVAGEHPISDWRRWMRSDTGASFQDTLYVVQHVLWNQIIDVDLTNHFDIDRINKTGGKELRDSLQKKMLRGTL